MVAGDELHVCALTRVVRGERGFQMPRGVLQRSHVELGSADDEVRDCARRCIVRTFEIRLGQRDATPAQMSVLVHEMVHHLQSAARLRYACPEEREALAYAAQEQWLRMHGRTLADDFEIDGFTLLASTRCWY